MSRNKLCSYVAQGAEANLILTALRCQADNYQHLAEHGDLPDRTADTFMQYAVQLREIASNVCTADYVEFGDYRG